MRTFPVAISAAGHRPGRAFHLATTAPPRTDPGNPTESISRFLPFSSISQTEFGWPTASWLNTTRPLREWRGCSQCAPLRMSAGSELPAGPSRAAASIAHRFADARTINIDRCPVAARLKILRGGFRRTARIILCDAGRRAALRRSHDASARRSLLASARSSTPARPSLENCGRVHAPDAQLHACAAVDRHRPYFHADVNRATRRKRSAGRLATRTDCDGRHAARRESSPAFRSVPSRSTLHRVACAAMPPAPEVKIRRCPSGVHDACASEIDDAAAQSRRP